MKNKKPVIRFRGFSEDWEKTELGELGNVQMNKRVFKEQTSDIGEIPFFKIGTFGEEPDAFISRELFEKYKSKYPYPKLGDTLISASGSIGRTVEYKGKDEYFQDSNIVWFDHENRLDNSFLKQFYSIVKWEGLEGSTIKRLYNKNILETKISFPSNTEQTQIGNFFKNLDTLITLHQRKYDKMVNVKKAMLEKMFPKNGADVPEIRFKGFVGAWEEKELSFIVSRVSSISDKIGLPRVEYEDIISGRGVLNKNIEQKESSKIGIEFDKGDVLYGKLRPYLNNWLLPNFKGIAVGDFWVFRPNETNSKFIFYLIQTSAYELKANQSSGTKMPRADWNLMSKTEFFIPSTKEEQSKIGSFFKDLDSLLTLHHQELKKLKNIKKAMLGKMFV